MYTRRCDVLAASQRRGKTRLIVAMLNPMPLRAHPLLFEFEILSSENLGFIPMCIRFNLDRCGIRITLAQWQALPHAERVEFTRYPLADSDAAAQTFAHALAARLAAADLGAPAAAADAPDLAWTRTTQVPAGLLQQYALHHLAPITEPVWGHLPEFQRYVLNKLSRRATANHDFLAALREFGLPTAA